MFMVCIFHLIFQLIPGLSHVLFYLFSLLFFHFIKWLPSLGIFKLKCSMLSKTRRMLSLSESKGGTTLTSISLIIPLFQINKICRLNASRQIRWCYKIRITRFPLECFKNILKLTSDTLGSFGQAFLEGHLHHHTVPLVPQLQDEEIYKAINKIWQLCSLPGLHLWIPILIELLMKYWKSVIIKTPYWYFRQ